MWNDFKILVLRNLKSGIFIYQGGEVGRKIGLGKENQKLNVGHTEFETPIRCSHGGEQQAVGSLHLSFKRGQSGRYKFGRHQHSDVVYESQGWTSSPTAAV